MLMEQKQGASRKRRRGLYGTKIIFTCGQTMKRYFGKDCH